MPITQETRIDITADVCPMTFVRVKLALERMTRDTALIVRLNDGEPLRNVPRSARAEGYVVEELGPEMPDARIHHLRITRQ